MLPFCAALGVSASLWGMRGGREEASTSPPVFLCMVTNGDYAPGAVCLAQSLALVGSKARLRVIATSESAQQALLAEAQNCPTPCPMDVVLEQCALPEAAAGAQTHGAKGATLAVDAPRRCLFDDSREGFILLDADLIAIQSPDALFPLLSAPTTTTSNFHASANFRLKKKDYGDVNGNFNAGVFAVPHPSSADGDALRALVEAATEEKADTTEELLMNQLFDGRWSLLSPGYNVPKRVLHHAPALWKQLVEDKEIVFLHYMGAKPWTACPERRKGSDWEAERPSYHTLEKVWWKVRRGELKPAADGTLFHALPLEKTPDAVHEQ